MEFGHFISVPMFAAHLVCMNVASAAPFIAIWLERRSIRNSDQIAGELGLRLTKHAIVLFFAGILLGLGVAALVWVQGDGTLAGGRLAPFRDKIWWGVWELVTYLVAMLGYLALWPKFAGRDDGAQGKKPSLGRVCFHRFLAVFAATDLLYHFPPLFTAIALYQGETVDTVISSAQFRAMIYSPRIMSQTVHFWFASFAVVGAWVMWAGRKARTPDGSNVTWPLQLGARISLASTLPQLLVGVWLTLSMPQNAMVLGGDWFASTALGVSVLLTFVLLNHLATLSFGVPEWPMARRAILVLLTIILLMSTTLRLVR